MIKVLLSGCCGKMGTMISNVAKDFENIEIVGGIDKFPKEMGYIIFKDPSEVNIPYDVILDFSRADSLDSLLSLSKRDNKGLVLCSTGYSKEQLETINEASKDQMLFKSANMSLGINLINSLLKKIVPTLYGNFDIEIIEKHHNQKVDSPSGTAILLGDTIMKAIPEETYYQHGREGHKIREKNEIGIHAVRGGSIVGDHDVIFAGNGEVIELSHKALSREVFAVGALKACEYMANIKEPGLYNMDNVIGL